MLLRKQPCEIWHCRTHPRLSWVIYTLLHPVVCEVLQGIAKFRGQWTLQVSDDMDM